MSHVFRVSQEPRRRIRRLLRTAMCALAILGVAPQVGAFPSLDEAVARAQAHAPSAVDARGSARVAESLEAGARVSSLGNPYVEMTGERGRVTRDVQINGSLFLPIEIQGQRGARIAEWERLVAWRRAGLDDALARTLRDATEAYGRARIASARLEQAERAEREATLEASTVAQRVRSGDATAYELSVAESRPPDIGPAGGVRFLSIAAAAGRSGVAVARWPRDGEPHPQARAGEAHRSAVDLLA